jgi:putative DNA primase/helicase
MSAILGIETKIFVEPTTPTTATTHALVQGQTPAQGFDFATDIGASERFAAAHAQDLRYAPGLGWLHWDGRRWATDAEGRAIELSKKSARAWTLKFVHAGSTDKAKAALTLEGSAHVKAAVELARVDPMLVVSVSKLDLDPWALNVMNGTINLRTGELRPHRREDLCTKLAPVTYDPAAMSDHLRRFIANCERSTAGMGGFLARCFGCALTGDAEAESLFLLQGEGGSGKTTLAEAVASMLGDYTAKLQFESFCLSKHGRSPGAASSDLMRLRGSRLAYASEGDQSAKLDAGMVKMLTGNEPITARNLYADPITVPQTWKLWLVSNYDPKADSEDSGIWRRMIKLNFTAIPAADRDPVIKRMLTTDAATQSALLAWAVAGCLDWQKRGGGRIGLAPPDAVMAATEAYRVKQDTMAQWWDDLLANDAKLDRYGKATRKEVREHYESWCDENGAAPVFVKRFIAYLEGKGLQIGRTADGARGWLGLDMNA